MGLNRPPLVVAFELSERREAILADALAGAARVVYLTELDDMDRAETLRNTGVLLTFNTAKELRPGETALLKGARLIRPDRHRRASAHEGRCRPRQRSPWGNRAGKATL
jgi:hypothetical protein